MYVSIIIILFNTHKHTDIYIYIDATFFFRNFFITNNAHAVSN